MTHSLLMPNFDVNIWIALLQEEYVVNIKKYLI